MFAVRFGFRVIRFSQFYASQFVGISPWTFSGNHIPPYADIFHRLHPWSGICDFAWLIQVQSDAGCKNIAGIIADDNGTPRSITGSLQITFVSFSIRSQPGFEYHIFVVQIQVHTWVIDESIRFHHQCSLYACLWERSLRRVRSNGFFHQTSDFWQAGDSVIIFLSVIVARYPVSDVVACHCKLGMFFFDDEVVQRFLLREFVAES